MDKGARVKVWSRSEVIGGTNINSINSIDSVSSINSIDSMNRLGGGEIFSPTHVCCKSLLQSSHGKKRTKRRSIFYIFQSLAGRFFVQSSILKKTAR